MKKVFLLLSFAALAYTLPAQTIVSTEPENRDAVLEEFTGRNCGYCPDGHVIAENLKTQHGDDFWIINIHAGGFSPSSFPNLNTPHGAAINNYFGVSSYPNGTINRHNWGQGVIIGRNTWAGATGSALADPAYCNVGVNARIDPVTRVVTADVEVYYTDNSPVTSNYINVAVLGNGIIGYQSGGGNDYVHNHFLIEMINENGPWGDEITTTTTGSLYSHTFTWTLPATMPLSNGPELDPETLEIVAFVTETDHADVINADGGAIVPIMPYEDDAFLKEVIFEERNCYRTVVPSVTVMNGGNNDLTAFDVEYSVNGGEIETYSWTGSVFTLDEVTFELPEIEYNVQAENTINVEVVFPDDENSENNTGSKAFDKAPISDESVVLHLEDGLAVVQLSWELKNSAGTVVQSGGNYTINQVVNKSMTLDDEECYTLYLYDSNGDGFSSGYLSITDSESNEVVYISGSFEEQTHSIFMTSDLTTISVNDLVSASNNFSVYPNPTNDDFSIYFKADEATDVTVKINDITGRNVYSNEMGNFSQGGHVIEMENLNLGNGLYFVSVETSANTFVQKIQILK